MDKGTMETAMCGGERERKVAINWILTTELNTNQLVMSETVADVKTQ